MLKIIPFKHKQPKPPIPHCLHITDEVANQIEITIGSLPAETGGFLGTSDGENIDHFYISRPSSQSSQIQGIHLKSRSRIERPSDRNDR